MQRGRLGALATVFTDKVTAGVDRFRATDALEKGPTALRMRVDVTRRGRVGVANLLLSKLFRLALKAVHGANV